MLSLPGYLTPVIRGLTAVKICLTAVKTCLTGVSFFVRLSCIGEQLSVVWLFDIGLLSLLLIVFSLELSSSLVFFVRVGVFLSTLFNILLFEHFLFWSGCIGTLKYSISLGILVFAI